MRKFDDYIRKNETLPLRDSLVSESQSTNNFISNRSRISLLYKTRIPSNRTTLGGYVITNFDFL